MLTHNSYASTRQRLLKFEGGIFTWYVWGGDQVLAEYTATNWGGPVTRSKEYFYAGSRLLSTITNVGGSEVTEFQHPDRLGTKLVTNNAANTSFEQSTLPYGTALNAESTGATNLRFTSYDRSSAGNIDYAVNRSYSSGQGRFTSVDPIGMSAVSIGNPQSMNLYAYVQNNPIDFTDPSGLFGGIYIRVKPKETDWSQSDWESFLHFLRDSLELSRPPIEYPAGHDSGGGGGSLTPPAQPQDNTRKTPLLRYEKCKQGKNGTDIWEIKKYLEHYGLDQFIDMNSIKMDTVGKDREGITFNFTNAAGAAIYLKDKSNGFIVAGKIAALFEQHNGSVSGGKVSLAARGIQGKGALPDKSLQFAIGSPVKNRPDLPIIGYADLDCDNPLQLKHLPAHLLQVFGIGGK